MYARDYRLTARQNLQGNWGYSVLVALIAAILGGGISTLTFELDIDMEMVYDYTPRLARVAQKLAYVSTGLGLIQFIVGGVIKLGNCTYLMKQYDGEHGEVSDLFSHFDRFADGFLLNLLTYLYTVLWSLLFIIPGIVASFSYAMAPFILTENPDMSAKEAITASKELMRGHRWELFCLRLSFIGWILLCALTIGIGDLFLRPYMAAAETAFYRNLSPYAGQTHTHTNQNTQAETPWDF